MVAIITLNYNQNEYTLKCIESVLSSEDVTFKIFLVDNGSSEENFRALKEVLPKNDKLHLERLEKNRGYVGGVNYGFEKANVHNPDYFLVMNNDTILAKEAVSELMKECSRWDDKAIVSGKVYHYDEPNKFQDIGYTYSNKKALEFKRLGLNEEDNGQYDEVAQRDMLDDVFWLFPKSLYHKIGGYSTFFWFSAEQADFALRAKKHEYHLIYTPEAKIWHKGSVSLGGRDRNPRLAYWHTQSTLIFRYRHLSKIQFLKQYAKVLYSVIASYIKTIISKIKGNKESFLYSKAKLSGFLYFNKWLVKRNDNLGFNPFS